MVGIFSAEVGQLGGSNVTPITPVKNPSNLALGLLAGAVGVGADMFKQQQVIDAKAQEDLLKQKAAVEEAAVISDYTSKLSSFAQAVSSGSMKRGEALDQVSRLYNKVVARNPGYVNAIMKAQTSMLGSGVIGGIIKEGTEEEKAYNVIRDKALAANAIPVGTPIEDEGVYVKKFQHDMQLEDQLKSKADQIALINAKLTTTQKQLGIKKAEQDLDYARLSQEKANLAADMENGLFAWSKIEFGVVNKQMADIVDSARQGGMNPTDVAEKLQAMDIKKAALEQQARDLARNNPAIGNVLKPMVGIIDVYKSMLDKSQDIKVLDNKLKFQQLRFEQIFNSKRTDKEREYLALSASYPYMAGLQRETSSIVIDALTKNSNSDGDNANPFPKDVNDQKEMSKYSGALLDSGFKSVSANDKEAVGEMKVQVNNFLKSGVEFGGNAKTLEQVRGITDFIADPKYKKWKNEVGLDQEATDAASNIVRRFYSDETLKVMRNNWEKGELASWYQLSAATGNKKYKDVFEPYFNGTSVVFKSKDATSSRGLDKLQNDDKLLGAINKQLRLIAHTEDMEYQEAYEKFILPYVFGVTPEAKGGESK